MDQRTTNKRISTLILIEYQVSGKERPKFFCIVHEREFYEVIYIVIYTKSIYNITDPFC